MKFGYNSKQYEQHETVISPYDHGFLYGMGLFETMRTYSGRVFLLDRHLKRLAKSMEWIGIQYEIDADRIEREIAALVQVNQLPEAYVRFSISAGIEPLGLPTQPYMKPNELILVKAVSDTPIEQTESKALQLLRTKRLAPETDIRMKSFHYMNAILAKQEMNQYAWATHAEGVMLTEAGAVSEGITSNVFIVKNKVVYTPGLESGPLPGVTRQFVIELARENGMTCEEAILTWQDVREADEVFMTNSVQAIVPIHAAFETDGTKTMFSPTRPITTHLQHAYATFIQRGEW